MAKEILYLKMSRIMQAGANIEALRRTGHDVTVLEDLESARRILIEQEGLISIVIAEATKDQEPLIEDMLREALAARPSLQTVLITLEDRFPEDRLGERVYELRAFFPEEVLLDLVQELLEGPGEETIQEVEAVG